MPFYCYTNDKGETVERMYRIGKQPSAISVQGKLYRRDIGAEHAGFKNTPGNWPYENDMGPFCCHASERKQLEQNLAASGVPTRVTERGNCIIESNDHRNRLMRLYGYHDKDACYRQRTR